MNSDSDLYGDDIRLWSERQGALLRRLSSGEAVSDQVDWQHVVGEIEDLGHDYAQRAAQNEVARLTARLAAAEAEVNELRARLEDLTGKLTNTQAELATTQDQMETATARAVAAVESEQAAGRSRAPGQGALASAQGGVVAHIGWHRRRSGCALHVTPMAIVTSKYRYKRPARKRKGAIGAADDRAARRGEAEDVTSASQRRPEVGDRHR